MNDLVILGASGLAREVLAVVRNTGSHNPIAVLDDAPGRLGGSFDGVPVSGPIAALAEHRHAEVVVCVGSGAARESIVEWLAETGVHGMRYATIVDPSVRNPGRCPIGVGSILLAQVTVTASAVIGEHVVMMPGCTVTHDDVVDDFATLAAGVSLGGGVRVGRGAYVGMNASVRQGVRLGVRSVVGMAAAVLHDVPDDETWAGVPAHPLTAVHAGVAS
jgi:sugar O-acyltransferase (sialic acid O-acetyltransferase NeuD family)